jgi:hypothetical protein
MILVAPKSIFLILLLVEKETLSGEELKGATPFLGSIYRVADPSTELLYEQVLSFAPAI